MSDLFDSGAGLGTTLKRFPRHPLYVKGDTVPEAYGGAP